jgi:hypothetical protein
MRKDLSFIIYRPMKVPRPRFRAVIPAPAGSRHLIGCTATGNLKLVRIRTSVFLIGLDTFATQVLHGPGRVTVVSHLTRVESSHPSSAPSAPTILLIALGHALHCGALRVVLLALKSHVRFRIL